MSYVLTASNLKKEFGDEIIFEGIDLNLKSGEKAALIGANGAGKTTLLKCLLGIYRPDEGSVKLESGASIGYVEQIASFAPETTLWEALESSFSDLLEQREKIGELEKAMGALSGAELEQTMKKYGDILSQYEDAEGFSFESKIKRVLLGLGFREDQFSRPFGSFSGGEKTKITLGCLLARERQIMFLDEPTNHLDLQSLEWLEEYLLNSSSAVIVISHDRFFLDRVTETTFNLDHSVLKRYNGGYSSFAKQKEAEDLAYQRAYEKQQEEIQELKDYIDRYRAGIKSKQARGRQSRLDRIKVMEKLHRQKDIAVNAGKLQLDRSGEMVLRLDKLGYAFPDKQLFSDLEEEISAGQRVVIVGPNGAGKSTLLKVILDEIKAADGHVAWGVNVKPGYFAQTHENLTESNTVLEEIVSNYPITLQEARDYLAAFLFAGDEIEKRIKNLSGGERARISFLKLYLTKANFLILDEPTNHMDIQSREAFEDFLKAYPGTILAVSHDRYFIDSIADRIWELEDGSLHTYLGNYSDYKQRKTAFAPPPPAKPETEKGEQKPKPKKDLNQAEARSRRAFLRKRLGELEAQVETGEARIEEINAILAAGEIYQKGGEELKQILDELEKLQEGLPLAYEEWEAAEVELAELA